MHDIFSSAKIRIYTKFISFAVVYLTTGITMEEQE